MTWRLLSELLMLDAHHFAYVTSTYAWTFPDRWMELVRRYGEANHAAASCCLDINPRKLSLAVQSVKPLEPNKSTQKQIPKKSIWYLLVTLV